MFYRIPFNQHPVTPVKKNHLVSQEFKADSSILRFVQAHSQMVSTQ